MRTAECLECLADVASARRRAARADDLRGDPRGVRLRALRRRLARGGRDERDRRRPAGRGPPRGAARSSSSRRPRPTSGSRRAPPPPTAGSTSSASPARPARATRSPPRSPASSSGRARSPTLPLYAGFGISTPEHAAVVAGLADGVVVGSRAVQVAEEGPAALRDYVRSLREAIDAVVVGALRPKIARRRRSARPVAEARQLVQLRLPLVGSPVSSTTRNSSSAASLAEARRRIWRRARRMRLVVEALRARMRAPRPSSSSSTPNRRWNGQIFPHSCSSDRAAQLHRLLRAGRERHLAPPAGVRRSVTRDSSSSRRLLRAPRRQQPTRGGVAGSRSRPSTVLGADRVVAERARLRLRVDDDLARARAEALERRRRCSRVGAAPGPRIAGGHRRAQRRLEWTIASARSSARFRAASRAVGVQRVGELRTWSVAMLA